MRKAVFFVLFMLFAALLVAAPPTKEDAKRWLTDLASAKMEGRGTGTRGGEIAASYIEARFREAGLTTLTGNSFRQNLPITRMELAEKPAMWIDGKPCKKGWSVTVFGGGGDVEGEVAFCGYGVSAPEMKFDDYAGVDVEGKVVVVLRGAPGWRRRSSPFHGRSRKHAFLTRKVEVAAKHGAAAVLIVSGVKRDDRAARAHFAPPAVRRTAKKELPPVLLISPKLAKRLLGKDVAQLAAKIDRSLKPSSFVCENVRVKLHVPLVARKKQACNVVGLLEGRDPDLRDRYVVVGAHYDHLGKRGSTIFYGADDNASGTTAVMALAGLLATDNRPRRSIIFVCFTGEELGYIGSSYFVEHPPVPLEKIDFMVNFDMVGRGLPWGMVGFFGGAAFDTIKRMAEKAAKAVGLSPLCTPHPGYRSDQAVFLNKGIPAVFVYCSKNPDYHTPRDTADKIDYENLWKVILAARTFIFMLADYDGVLTPWSCNGLPRLGAFFEEREEKLFVRRVLGDSPAAKAGLKAGDEIVEVAGKPCRNFEELEAALKKAAEEKYLRLEVRRAGMKKQIILKLPGKKRKGGRGPRLPIR